MIFIGCNFESRASQVAQAVKRYSVEEDEELRLCSRSNGTRLGRGRLKILPRWPAGRLAGVGFLFLLIYSQKAKNVQNLLLPGYLYSR